MSEITSIDDTPDVSNNVADLSISMEIVKVNVGGEIFKTRRQTLKKSGYFRGLFAASRDNDLTEHFIDRDPKIFRKLLNYMRDPSYKLELEKYSPDFIYYEIEIPKPAYTIDDLNIQKEKPTTRYMINEKGHIILCGYIHEEYNTWISTGISLTIPKGHMGIIEAINGMRIRYAWFREGKYKDLIIEPEVTRDDYDQEIQTRLDIAEGFPIATLRIIPVTYH